MSGFYGFSILGIVFFIITTGILLKDLYTFYIHGRSILKVEKGIGLVIFWMVLIIVWCLLLWQNVKFYVRHENNGIINNIVTNIFWIEFSISNIIKSLRSLEIRENGIYKSGYFYKWSKIRSYNWTTPNTIEFKVSSFLKINSSIEFTINEEYKAKVEEVIQRNIAL